MLHGDLFLKQYANAITRHEQNLKINPHATSVINKLKQKEERKTQAEMDACMNKKQKVPVDQQAANM